MRLAKWYDAYTTKERTKIVREVSQMVLGRAPRLCNFLDWRDKKIIYKRYRTAGQRHMNAAHGPLPHW